MKWADPALPGGCSAIQTDGLVAGGPLAQRWHVSIVRCEGRLFGWLAESDETRTMRLVDRVELPSLGYGEQADLAGGACTIGGRIVRDNLLVIAAWSGRSGVLHGRGLRAAWLPDARRGRWVPVDSSRGLACRADMP